MAAKMTPLEALSIEMGNGGCLKTEQYDRSFRNILDVLDTRSLAALKKDPKSADSIQFAQDFLVFSETLAYIGQTLLELQESESLFSLADTRVVDPDLVN